MNGEAKLNLNFDNIPQELKELDRWVCWRWEEKFKKDGTPDAPAKMPINPSTGGRAMSNNPATWGTFYDAVKAFQDAEKGDIQGIGFMFNGDGIIGVDIDHCRDINGNLTEQSRDIISTLDSYTEYSQSGKGVHIICYGKLPEGGRRKDDLEMYSTGRYFIVTGNTLDDAHTSIEERTEELAAVHGKYINVKKQGKNEQKSIKNEQKEPVFVSDDEIIEIALNAKNGSLFNDLMNGNWKGRYNSQSEADIALCNLLAFYCQKDHQTVDRLFRRSGLMRDKWNERHGESGTYGRITINKAIADCGEVYSPKQKQTEQPPEIENGLEQLAQNAPPEQLPEWITGPYNDTWNAERLITSYGENIRYNPSRGWFIWNGKYWEYDELNKIRTMANESIERLYRYKDIMRQAYTEKAPKKYSGYMDWLAKSRNTSRKDNMIKEAESWEGIRTLQKQFDAAKCLVNLQNGTMDMEREAFLPHNKDDLITKIMPVEYDSSAKVPLWNDFLNKIFEGNQNIIKFLQRAAGYSVTALTNEQCIFILYGTGKNGKSTFLDTLKTLMADYAKNAPVSTFMRKDWSNTNTYELARLYGARLVTTGEPDKGDRFAESLIKQVTGGESINAEHKYKDPFEFYPDFKLWIGTNYKPEIVGTDLGIWRRIMLVPFEYTIPPEERDINFGKKLLAELPGIFNWVMEGCKEWQKQGLNPPKEVLAATEDYREEMDVFQNFLNDCMVQKPSAVIKFKDLYTVYKEWARENGIKNPMNTNTIGRRLKEKGIKEHNDKTAKGREGIELSEEGKRLWRKGTEFVGGNNNMSGYQQESCLDDEELPF